MTKNLPIVICDNFISRLKGLMFKRKIDKVLCFSKCNSIHTFFMLSNIDIYMTDKENKVLYIYKDFKPFKLVLPKKNVYYTYETPVNYLKYKVGDIYETNN